MIRTIIVLAGLALLFAIAAGSFASARIASAQMTKRVAMNDTADVPETDAVKHDRWAGYWNRAVSEKDLEVFHPVRRCAD
jgi:hypothetical protein